MDEILFKKIAEEVEAEWKMGGLSDGVYFDYALKIAKRYFSIQQSNAADPQMACAHKNTFKSKMGGTICEDCGEYI